MLQGGGRAGGRSGTLTTAASWLAAPRHPCIFVIVLFIVGRLDHLQEPASSNPPLPAPLLALAGDILDSRSNPTACSGPVLSGLVRSRPVWFGIVQYGLVWSGLV